MFVLYGSSTCSIGLLLVCYTISVRVLYDTLTCFYRFPLSVIQDCFGFPIGLFYVFVYDSPGFVFKVPLGFLRGCSKLFVGLL